MTIPNPNQAELLQAFTRANEVARIARTYHVQLPDGYEQANAVAAAAGPIAAEPAPAIPAELPAAEDVADWCDAHAAALDEHRGRVAVAAQLADRAKRAAAQLALSAAPDVASAMTNDINARVMPRLTELLQSAPRTITGYSTPAETKLHTELLLLVGEAHLAAHNRAQIALVLGEGDTLGSVGVLFLIVDLAEHAVVDDVQAAIGDIQKNGLPNSIERWAAVAALGALNMAGGGEATYRLDRFHAARAAQSRTPDGGMARHTIGELTELAAAHAG